MSSGREIRTRSDRVARLELPPGQVAKIVTFFKRSDVLSRIAICFVASSVMWLATTGWKPTFPFRVKQTPARNIVSRVTFDTFDEGLTREAKDKARRETLIVYRHDPEPLNDLQGALTGKVHEIVAAGDRNEVSVLWREFTPDSDGASQQQFEAFREELASDPSLEKFKRNIDSAFLDYEKYGLLESLQHGLEEGPQSRITVVYDSHDYDVEVDQVRLASISVQLREDLVDELGSEALAGHVFAWLKDRLPVTLTKDSEATKRSIEAAAKSVEDVFVTREAGRDLLAEGGKPLGPAEIELLEKEHASWIDQTTWWATVARGVASFGMYFALYLLCGVYLFYRRLDLLKDTRKFIMIQVLVVATVTLAKVVSKGTWQLELIPLMLFGMTAVIAYRQEIALLFSAAVCLVVVLSIGLGLPEFVIWTATLAATIMLLRNVRSRTKLIYIGLTAGAVAFLTALGVETSAGREVDLSLLASAGWYTLLAAISGILMTGILPFIESMFDVQTEISLLELGDIAHPLLQELVRRAPGTYNHSINVASIAEAAAERIGANGLLLRVGAYFHDIGKMLKPQYFVENQGSEENRHETLLPAMSTLIIIAHVKDGADLARQHHLPQSLIDLILQHHGTTLVEYFFSRASKQSEEDPDAGDVDEGSYRYPGPKPQTREAGVLMLADSVESASRTLTEPAPARIESLVQDIAMKKLLDGQFDECGLTLQELRIIEDSLVKSLTAVYHGRVKYPDQATA